MRIIEFFKDIIFKIKDYDRLEHDYSLCLCYFTNNRLSKTTYEIKGLETVICDTIGEYQEEGYKHAIDRAEDWIKQNCVWNKEFIKSFRKHMEEEL